MHFNVESVRHFVILKQKEHQLIPFTIQHCLYDHANLCSALAHARAFHVAITANSSTDNNNRKVTLSNASDRNLAMPTDINDTCISNHDVK